MKRIVPLFAALFILSACSGRRNVQNPIDLQPLAQRVEAPEISGDWLNISQPLRLSELRGKVVLLNFWATWCGPCRMEMPGLVKVRAEFRSKGFEVVGLSIDQADPKDPSSPVRMREYIKKFIESQGVLYPLAVSSPETAQTYRITSIPASYLIDKNGKVAQTLIGLYPEDAIADAVERLLKETPDPSLAIPKP